MACEKTRIILITHLHSSFYINNNIRYLISSIRVYTSIQDVSLWVCQAIRDALCHISGVITLGTFLYFNEKFLLHLLSKRLLECTKIYGWAIVFSFSSSMPFFSCRGASKNNCFVYGRKCLSRVMRSNSVYWVYKICSIENVYTEFLLYFVQTIYYNEIKFFH